MKMETWPKSMQFSSNHHVGWMEKCIYGGDEEEGSGLDSR